jgi:aminopeptidase N
MDARRAFPCFDEPDFKSVFELSFELSFPSSADFPLQNYTVISNMPVASQEVTNLPNPFFFHSWY